MERQLLLAQVPGDPGTISEMIRAVAATRPDAPAVTDGHVVPTYAELLGEAGKSAAALRRAGVRSGDVVALCAVRSVKQLTAVLAAMTCGAAVAPFDPKQAPVAAREALQRLRPALVVADHEGRVVVSEAVRLDELSAGPSTPAEPGAGGAGLACVLHTSGSSGRPKSVLVPHSALLNRFRWGQSVYPIGPGDTVLSAGSPAFDISLWSGLAPLCFGASVLVAPASVDGDLVALAGLMDDHAVTAAHFVPTMLREFLAETAGAGLSRLKYLFVGGERLSPELARAAAGVTPARVFNQYGPTESCIDILTREVVAADLAAESVPIGEAISGIRTQVCGADGQPVAAGEPGELLVGGACLAWGYGDAAATAAAFVPDAFSGVPGARLYRTGDLVRRRADGVTEFLGRVDDQVKIRGVRVEPSDVDHVLAAHPAVADVAVVATAGDGGFGLVAHVVPAGPGATAAELRAFAADRVISAAVPDVFVMHAALPRLTSGKIDRAALTRHVPGPGSAVPPPEPVRTDTERRIAEIWAGLLKADGLGRTADFFRLGGQSLLTMRMVARVRAQFGVRLSVRTVFTAPTVAEFAAVVDDALDQEETARAGL